MPENANVQSRSEKLDCSFDSGICHEEHAVYEFSPSAESQKAILYSPEGEKCESKTTHSSTNACVYNLPMQDANAAKDWTKCAVATCGKLLFGRKSKPGVGTESTQVVVLSAALVFTSVVVVLLALVVCFLNRRNNTELYTASTSYKSITETFKKGDILYYVAMEQTKNKATRRHQDDTWSECVYFNVQ
ncbi:hypothetical protein WMY93_017267 [Mugilogobius chulae]|uniref:Uncharacterized protein n=1 Tax=Mugilogobius chulae TaxID=88201 RepID=A0AAW0NXV8_9GOBI